MPIKLAASTGTATLALVVSLALGSTTLWAQTGGNYKLSRFTVDGGGWTFSIGSGYELGSTMGQPDAGGSTGGGYTLAGGFWSPTPQVSAIDVDLTVGIVESIDPVIAGSGIENLIHSVTVTNNGPADASGLVLTYSSMLPAGVNAEISPSVGTLVDSIWTVGNLAAGASETLIATLTVDSSAAVGTDAICNAVAVAGANEVLINTADDSATECTSVARPAGIEIRKLIASDGAAMDYFGWSVASSGSTLVVGAVGNDDAGSDSGSAYIFERDQGGAEMWGEVKKITASDAAAGDLFGRSAAFSGDTVVIGASETDDAGSSSGSVYVFERDQGGAGMWGEVRKITASDAAPGDLFGFSVAISGNTLVVGAPTNDDAGSDSGSIYVFERDLGGVGMWGEVKKVSASDAAADDRFGESVTISGDTIVVGAVGDDDGGSNSGSTYVFGRDQGGAEMWGEVKKITASDAAAGDLFGNAVAIAGSTLVVGAWAHDEAGNDSGSAYVFERDQGGADVWGEVKKVTASDAAVGDSFGRSVTISGSAFVAGAMHDDDGGADSGSTYVFERNMGGADMWGEVDKLTASDAAAGDELGWSTSLSGNLLVAGAWLADNGAGSAYVFDTNVESGFPTLTIPSQIGTAPATDVEVPINFTGNGSNISSLLFTVDLDESCLDFDPTDADMDGVPDSVTFNLPGDFFGSVAVTGDPASELDFAILDASVPLATLPDDTLSTLLLTPNCTPSAVSIIAPVAFTAASFGDTGGQDVIGSSVDGSVEILAGSRGDCNNDDIISAGDLSAGVLETFDGDGTFWLDVPGSTFAGSPVGCDSNADTTVGAGDISCTILLFFGGTCGGARAQQGPSPVLTLQTRGEQAAASFHGSDVNTLMFSLDYDETSVRFDDTDRDNDGLPDAITLEVPADVVVSVTHDARDRDGEIDVMLLDTNGALPSSPLMLIDFERVYRRIPKIHFSLDPAPSFGTRFGASVEGEVIER